jgi:hypothetical protein
MSSGILRVRGNSPDTTKSNMNSATKAIFYFLQGMADKKILKYFGKCDHSFIFENVLVISVRIIF